MFMREFVHLLWIIEGPKFMRAHAGNVFFYHPDGAFVPYRGACRLAAQAHSRMRVLSASRTKNITTTAR
jgi:hypothetical protein